MRCMQMTSKECALSPSWSVVILSRHTRQAGSSRLRTHQYIPFLEAQGADVVSMPFFNDSYLNKLYVSGRREAWDVARAYARRLLSLATMRRASVVWIEKEIFPFIPGIVEALPSHLGVRYVVDYDDATFHTYDQHANPIMRRLLASKLDGLFAALERSPSVTDILKRMCILTERDT